MWQVNIDMFELSAESVNSWIFLERNMALEDQSASEKNEMSI